MFQMGTPISWQGWTPALASSWLGAQLVQVMTGSRYSSPLAPDIAAVSWGKGRREDPAEKRISEKRCSKMQAHPSAHLPTVTSVPETQVL